MITVLWFAKDAESIVTNVTKKFALTAVFVWNAQAASRIFASIVFCVQVVRSFVFADIAKTVPSCVPIVTSIVRSVTITSAWTAELATIAQAVNRIFVTTVSYAAVAPKFVLIADIVQIAQTCVLLAENIVQSVTITFVPTAARVTSVQAAKKIFVIRVFCVRVAL